MQAVETTTRILGLGLVVLGLWVLTVMAQKPPPALGADAPAGIFSAARADSMLASVLGPERPHPAGSTENAALRGRLIQTLAGLGVAAQPWRGMSCYGGNSSHAIVCGTVTNLFVPVTAGTGAPVLLMAHLDSVAAGPGGCDDGCGVAALLESIRALKASGFRGAHPIAALFTDGEEDGLLGASAFLRLGNRPAAVINFEARGDSGPSYLFQTSAGNAPLIDRYAHGVTRYAASSLYDAIYRYLPNDTDFSPFLKAGVPGYNFALIGNVSAYHTPRDSRAHIDRGGLQQHGDAALGLARALANADPATFRGGDAIYVDVLGRWLPRLPMIWALPCAILCFLAIALAWYFTPRARHTISRPLLAALAPVLLVLLALASGYALHAVAAWIGGTPDPAPADAGWLRAALALGVWSAALIVAPLAGGIACWCWFAGLAVVSAIWLPGLSPYFLFPTFVAAALLLLSLRQGRVPALLLSAPAAILLWLGIASGAEAIGGLSLHPLFTVPLAFALMPLLPFLAGARKTVLMASVLVACGLAVVAGFMPAHNAATPERMNIVYAENGADAAWLVDPAAPPPALRAAAGQSFSAAPLFRSDLGVAGFEAAARRIGLVAPTAEISARASDSVTLQIHGTPAADSIILHVPAQTRSLAIDGVTMPASGETRLYCRTPDCAHARVMLDGDLQGATLDITETRPGLPPQRLSLAKARPDWALPFGTGDRTLVGTTLKLP